MATVQQNFNNVCEKIETSAHRSGRDPEDVTLVAATKTVPAEKINEAINAGVKIIGENRVQEAQNKFEHVAPVTWHMVGHLQTNKVKHAVHMFDMIQSVDSVKLAKEINKRCRAIDKKMPVLIEVNTSGESSKYGCQPDEAPGLAEKISQYPNLSIMGLMTIGLFSDDPDAIRPCFIKLRELANTIREKQIAGVDMGILSMGMTSDFEIAIEEGSTMVRIGTAIFGERDYE